MNRDAILEVKHLSKSFGANAVLKDIDFCLLYTSDAADD